MWHTKVYYSPNITVHITNKMQQQQRRHLNNTIDSFFGNLVPFLSLYFFMSRFTHSEENIVQH